MVAFARDVERHHAGPSPNLEKHARNILLLGEMVAVPSDRRSVFAALPEATRAVFAPVHARVRPALPTRLCCRVLGRFLVPKAIGAPRTAVPWSA
jgi:hypothetical protein